MSEPPKPVKVTLNRHQLRQSAAIALERRFDAVFEGIPPKHGCPPDDVGLWGQDIEAAAAELAVAHRLDQPWNSQRGAKVDVGTDIQVRHCHTHPIRWGKGELPPSLIVRDSDSDDDRFVFVVGMGATYFLLGWCSGARAKDERFLRQPNGRPPAYFVPIAFLGDVRELYP